MSQKTVQAKMSVRVLQVREIESCVVCRCVVVNTMLESKCVLIRVEIIHEVPEDHIDLPLNQVPMALLQRSLKITI